MRACTDVHVYVVCMCALCMYVCVLWSMNGMCEVCIMGVHEQVCSECMHMYIVCLYCVV